MEARTKWLMVRGGRTISIVRRRFRYRTSSLSRTRRHAHGSNIVRSVCACGLRKRMIERR